MALNFPNSPTLNQVYTDSTSGFSYQWNGTVWISFSPSSSSQIKTLDDISASFNSSTTIFPLTSSGNAITPPTSQSLIINLGGVVQDPTDDYSVSGSNIVFSTAPTNGLSFSGVSLGPAVPIGISTIGDVYNRQVYSVTGVQTSFAFPSGYTVGYLDVFRNGVRLIAGDDFTATTGNSFSLSPPAQNTDDVEAIGYKVSTIAVTEGNLINLIVNQNATVLGITSLGAGVGAGQTALFVQGNVRIAGITTITNASGTVTIGIGTTALLVEGNARVTGILTVGSSSITLNGITDIINVGAGVTINGTTGTISATSFSGDGSGLTGVGVGTADNINTTGIITATSFSGDGSGLTGVGVGTDGSVNTTGNISAGIATFTRLDVPPIPITFSPAIGATSVAVASNIIITFDQQVYKGTGNITLRENSAGGTAFSTIGVSSSSVTISGGAVTIDPPANIGTATTTFVVVDAGAFSGLTTTSVNALINTYSFTTIPLTLSSINPANGATAIGVGTNITLTFNAAPVRGTGTITLRSGSTSGSVIESFDAASSGQISISGSDYIIDPTSNLGFSTSIHTIIPSTAIQNYVGLNTTGADTHSFTTVALNLGDSYEGGFLICKASPLRWVVSPYSAEVTRSWYLREDANTTAQSVSGCTGWFVPTCGQLQNPGYCCRSFWGPSPCFSSAKRYWSSTETNASLACDVYFNSGNADNTSKTSTFCVRAFRCVTY
jgi:hypothetical protein